MKKILIVCPYPTQVAPSQRFRFEQYLQLLISQGYVLSIRGFLSAKSYSKLRSGSLFDKIAVIAQGFIKRLFMLLEVGKYDFVFIHREAMPIGPPIIEWIIAKIFKRKVIYDFDDAIWLTDKLAETAIERLLRWRSKVKSICSYSYKISAGNDYLGDYAKRFNNSVYIIPTTIDTDTTHKVNRAFFDFSKRKNVVIGWTGSSTTVKYLEQINTVLQQIEQRHPEVIFLIIADVVPTLQLKNMIFKKWNYDTEIADLSQLDIGIMPLPDDEWTKGKCGFKALQYMALEIPAVVSAVGVNLKIVTHETEGFVCQTPDDWLAYLELLILNEDARIRMGKAGRRKVIERYSVESNASRFLSLFQ